MLTLGGDHTIALPLLRAVHAVHGPVAVVHFDAHLDTWDTYFGAPYTHGTPFRRAFEEGLLDPEGCLHVGIRGPLYDADDLAATPRSGSSWCPRPSRAPRQARRDRADRRPRRRPPGLRAASTSTCSTPRSRPAPAPQGGRPDQPRAAGRAPLFAGLNLVGADIVEVAPAYDHAQITGIAAAHVGYELLSALALGKG